MNSHHSVSDADRRGGGRADTPASPASAAGAARRPGCQRSRTRALARRLLCWARRALMLFGLVFAILLFTPVLDVTYPKFARETPLQKSDYILCLGGDAYRILEAAQLWKEGWAPRLVVSNHDKAADEMRDQAIAWGAAADAIIVDRFSWVTADHPAGIRQATGLDPATARCIIVTGFTHMPRSEAVFKKAGYKHIILREPRWSRYEAPPRSVIGRLRVLGNVVYECAAWVEYWTRGYV